MIVSYIFNHQKSARNRALLSHVIIVHKCTQHSGDIVPRAIQIDSNRFNLDLNLN
jgi:hypothetical protein